MSRNNYDQFVPLRDMEFESLTSLDIAGQSFSMLDQAQRLISNRLHVPHSYLVRCPQGLQKENLNYWLSRERNQRDSFFVRFNGNQIRAIFTERYTAIDNTEILHKMLNSGFRPDQQVQYLLDDNMMIVRVPEFNHSFEVSFKDEVVPGLSFGNSEIGCLSFCIECFYLRLVCTNGLTVSTTIGQSRFKHISRKAFDEFPETIRQVADGSYRQRDQMTISVQRQIDNPLQTIEAYNKQFGLTNEEGKVVKVSWEQEPGYNLWSVIQAYTASAKVPWLDVEDAYKLERVGGRILAMVN
jgi:hypothetical protein